jgi:CHAT domain-containing protein
MNAHPHPPDEILGAFLDGRLDGTQRAAVVVHLSECAECVDLLGGARRAMLELQPQEEQAETKVVPFRRRPWFLAAAAAIAAIVASFALLQRSEPDVETLIAAAPASHRTIEARLSGFRWAALQQLRGEAHTDPETLKLAGAAGEVLTHAHNDNSPSARHAAGVASLLVRDNDTAVAELQKAALQSNDAAAWNDLAAALYTSATQERRSEHFAQALAAANHALEREPSNAEARFNRALILERMGLQADAAAAWREYLAVDANSPWAAEARRRLDALPAKPQARFRDRIPSLESAAAANDRARVAAILAEFPYEVRAWYEADVLGRWGDAQLRGSADAATLLDGARTVAAALQKKSGESLLAHAVTAIDTASDRNTLARAHVAYRAARLAYRDGKLAESERLLREAAQSFGNTPMRDLATAYAASVVFDQNRIHEAATLLEPIVAKCGDGHIALCAYASLLRGRCDLYATSHNDALRHFRVASDAYHRTGEPANIAEAEQFLGETHANAGDAQKAWEHRLAALQILGNGAHGTRLVAALAADARGELSVERPDSAEALLRLEIAEAQRIGDPILAGDAYKRRAMLHAQQGDVEAALTNLREARGVIAKAPESGFRTRLEAECALVEGTALRTRDGKRSIALLTSAVDFARGAGDRRLLPDALYERARTHRAAGRLDDAWRDVAAGIEDVDARDGGSALYAEAIDLLLARGDETRAFEYAERALGNEPSDPSAIAAALPAGGAFVEYALLPDRIAIFHISRAGLRVAQKEIRRAAIEQDIRTLRAQLEARDSIEAVHATAARLDSTLIAPLRAFGDATSLVIAGESALQSVPWAALWSGREYLVERAAILVAPNAGVWLRSRDRAPARDDRLLLVTSDLRSDLDPLGDLRRERTGVEASYANRALLSDADATASRFLADAEGADVVHYAGHARAGSEVTEAALLLGDRNELSASQIARARFARPWLVVLAACGTMSASKRAGAPDLARAFLSAGIPTVVGTLWPVRDSDAATLFIAFHERIRSGHSAPAALREAQLAMLHGSTPEAAHPAAWAASQVLGGTH